MNRLLQILRSPGSKPDIHGVAPTQHVHVDIHVKDSVKDHDHDTVSATPDSDNDKDNDKSHENITGYTPKPKPRLLDRWLDRIVRFSGSPFVFCFIQIALALWAFMAIPTHASMDWQVLISDVQAIVSYVFDSFLMRQLINGFDEGLGAAAELRSRGESLERMLASLSSSSSGESEGNDEKNYHPMPGLDLIEQECGFDPSLPPETWFSRLSTTLSKFIGHIVTISLFWLGIVIWLAFGHACSWSDLWQMYINSATSALMIFVFSFMANIRERHDEYTRFSLDAIYRVDAALELKLRVLTGDTLPNPTVVISTRKPNLLQRGIYYYADVVGTLVGIVLLIVVIAVWIVIGPAMEFNSNWWLIIGTYAGLVGMNDGFVLRNVQAKLRAHEDREFAEVLVLDERLFGIVHLQLPRPNTNENDNGRLRAKLSSLTHLVSVAMGYICSHEITVLAGFLVIVGLIIGASALKWSTTGQLLCNVPPSIIESFFMIILITGHNLGDARRRADLDGIYQRRLRLLAFVQGVERMGSVREKGVVCEEIDVDAVAVAVETGRIEEVV